ncbi:MAG: hypothetical protein MUP04_08860 [Anaerolineae bacterium]|nr:hypothetical protein [Anaerolineae bacterium]
MKPVGSEMKPIGSEIKPLGSEARPLGSDSGLRRISVPLPTDENGMIGRECPNPECGQYFKLKPGTGLQTSECICPYCRYKGQFQEFHTEEQIEYARSVAVKQFLEPELSRLHDSFQNLERSTRGGFVQIKVKTTGFSFPLKLYQERELETHVTCASCGLEFAVYGVFAGCPDCGQLNAAVVFSRSIEVALKRLALLESIEDADQDLKEGILSDALSGGVSSFDAFGKALRNANKHLLPQRPRNLFQNLAALSNAFTEGIGRSLPDLIGEDAERLLKKMFQVRHIYEHNMGVVDDDFVQRIPDCRYLKGRKYLLGLEEVAALLNTLLDSGLKIQKALEEASTIAD